MKSTHYSTLDTMIHSIPLDSRFWDCDADTALQLGTVCRTWAATTFAAEFGCGCSLSSRIHAAAQGAQEAAGAITPYPGTAHVRAVYNMVMMKGFEYASQKKLLDYFEVACDTSTTFRVTCDELGTEIVIERQRTSRVDRNLTTINHAGLRKIINSIADRVRLTAPKPTLDKVKCDDGSILTISSRINCIGEPMIELQITTPLLKRVRNIALLNGSIAKSLCVYAVNTSGAYKARTSHACKAAVAAIESMATGTDG